MSVYLSLSARPGWLRLHARKSIGSWFEQALVARRQQHFVYRAETELDFRPALQHVAGLAAYYNRTKFHCLAIGWDETVGRSLTILSSEGDYPEGRLSSRSIPQYRSAPTRRSALRFPSIMRASSSPTGSTAANGSRRPGP